MATLIEQLRELRISQGLSQRKLSTKAGYFCATVQSWEKGRYTIKDPALVNLAQAMGYEFVLRPIKEVRDAKSD